MDGLGVYFFFVSSEVVMQFEQVVVGVDDVVEVWFFEVYFGEYFEVVFEIEFGEFCFELVVECDDFGFFGCGVFVYGVEMRVVFEVVGVDVGEVYCWFGCQQVKVVEVFCIVGVYFESVSWFEFVEMGLQLFEQSGLFFCFMVVVFGSLGDVLQGFFDGLEIGECKFGVDYFDVIVWIDVVGDVSDVFVFEVVYDVCDCFDFVNVC